MKTYILSILLLALTNISGAQNVNIVDTTNVRSQDKFVVAGYVDSYYSYDFNQAEPSSRPYFVSSARHNEFTINLAFIDLKYSSNRLRGRFVPGFGTYINANYFAEPASLKNIIEASAGALLSSKHKIWLDVGIFSSPFTNESIISKDQLVYSRSFAPEFVPYYLSGLKVSTPISPNLNLTLYLVNGWQQIQEVNNGKAVAASLEFRPNDQFLINWNIYNGSEKNIDSTHFRSRHFSDVYFTYSKNKIAFSACTYVGLQTRESQKTGKWYTYNVMGRYDLTSNLSLSGRFEYFSDLDNVIVKPITASPNFDCYSYTLGLNRKVLDNMLFRFEGRGFYSGKEVFFNADNNPTGNSFLLTANATIWY